MLDKLKAAWAWARAEILTYPMWLPAAIAAVLAQGTTLGWWTLDATQTGEVTAVATAALGLAAAFLTSNVGVTVIVTVLQAVGSLCVGFTFHGSQKVGLYIGAILTILGVAGHWANSPKYGPRGVKAARSAQGPHSAGTAIIRVQADMTDFHAQLDEATAHATELADRMHSVTTAGEPISVPVDQPAPEAHCPEPTGDPASAAAKKGWATRRARAAKTTGNHT